MEVHGQKGVYCGGDWISIEDCHKLLNNKGHKQCSNCPSVSAEQKRMSAANEFYVVVVGAGCVGACIARELSKYNLRVALLEKR
jgi:hypothetical protein